MPKFGGTAGARVGIPGSTHIVKIILRGDDCEHDRSRTLHVLLD